LTRPRVFFTAIDSCGQIAPLAEQKVKNLCIAGSMPALPTTRVKGNRTPVFGLKARCPGRWTMAPERKMGSAGIEPASVALRVRALPIELRTRLHAHTFHDPFPPQGSNDPGGSRTRRVTGFKSVAFAGFATGSKGRESALGRSRTCMPEGAAPSRPCVCRVPPRERSEWSVASGQWSE
jgi:hypothetical protein